MAEEASVCAGGCGQPVDEAHDPATMRTWQVQTVVCQACLVMQAQMENDSKDNPGRGRLYGVTRTRG